MDKFEFNKTYLLERIVENSPYGICVVDTKGYIVFASPKAFELFGVRKDEELVGFNIKHFVAGKFIEIAKENIEKVLKGKKSHGYVYALKRKDGTEFYGEINSSYFTENNKPYLLSFIRDVSKSEKAKFQLENSEHKFKEIFQGVAEGVIYFDKKGHVEEVNQRFCEIVGVEKEELVGKDFSQLAKKMVSPSQLPMLLRDISQNFTENKIRKFNLKYKNRILEAQTISNSQTLGLTALIKDITESSNAQAEITRQNVVLKESFQKLEEKEAYLQSIFKSAPTGIGVVVNRIIVFVNQKVLEISGYSKDELLGNHAVMLYPTVEESERVGGKKYQDISKFGTGSIETRWKCKNGEIKNILLSSTPIDRNDLSKGVTFSALDITTSVEAEKSLRENERKYRLLFNSIADPTFFIEKYTGKILDVNNKAIEVYGYSRKEFCTLRNVDISAEPEKTAKYTNSPMSYIPIRYHRTKFGRVFPLEFASSIVEMDNKQVIIATGRDISERLAAENALIESEKRLSLAIEGANLGIWVQDFKSQKVFRNPNWSKILGYKPNEITDDIVTWENLIHPDDKEHTIAIARKHEKGVLPEYRVEHRLRTKNGTWKWVLNWGKILERNTDGDPLFAFGIHMDIDSRKKAEQQMKESEERYKILANATDEGIVISEKGYCIDVNEVACKIFGYARDEFIGLFGTDVVAPESVDLVKENMLSGNEEPYEAKAIRKDGSVFPAMFHGRMYEYKGKYLRLTICRDLTEQKEHEQDLISAKEIAIENEAKYRELTEMLPEIVVEVDRDLNFVFINKSGRERLGIEIYNIGKFNFYDIIDPSGHSQLKQSFELSFEHEQKGGDEYSVIDKSGDLFPAIIYNNSVEKNDSIVGFRCILVDITELKNAERLRNEVKIAEKAAKLKQQFLANMSHEIRTPMTGIIGMTDFLLETQLDEQQEDYVSIIKESSESLLFLINDVLDLSKIEQNKMILHHEVVNLYKLLQGTVNMFKGIAKQKDININLTIDDSFPQFIALDLNRFKQIVSNLISNAIKYTRKGSVYVKLVKEELDKDSVKGRISIIDTGIGISKENQEKIFDIFSRLDNSYTRNTEGTGLGLAIAKRLIEIMNGEIGVESKIGEGSEFWFTFEAPVKSPDLRTEQDKSNLKDVLKRMGIKVLLAEDKLVNQKVISLILENVGCTVIIANNGLEVLDKFEENKFDVIFMDIMMPKMDGIAAMQNLHASGQKLPPIIGLSANAMEGDAEKYVRLGMDDYLTKPIKSDLLLEKLMEWVKK